MLENWYIIVCIAAVVVCTILAAVNFTELPTSEQIKKVKELLLIWVTEAEKQLGSGTGAIKLRAVYDIFTARFPVIARVVKFETFSMWVDEALEELEVLLQNEKIEAYVKNEI